MQATEGRARHDRKLAAILAADIVGYASLVAADEEAAVKDLKSHQAVLLPLISDHSGRVIDIAGDGILAEFASALRAVECACAIQDVMAKRNATADPGRRMHFRIGVNLGDVIFDATRLYGDNPWQGEMERARLKSDSKLSLVVLPFANLTNDLVNDYLADSLTVDVISYLARVRGGFVIARNTAFTYKGKSVDAKRIGQELGISYVLEGGARRTGASVTVDVQLVDAGTGGVLWVDRFDGNLGNLQSLNEEIIGRLARTLSLSLVDLAARKAAHVEKPDVAELVLRGRAAYYSPVTITRERCVEIRAYFQAALALAPEAVDALVGVALVDVSEYSIFNTPVERLSYAEEALNKALIIEPNHAWGRYARAFLFSMTNRMEAARDEALVAISLDPSLVDAYARLAQIETFLGRPQEALERLESVRRLSPLDPFLIYWDVNRAHAHVMLGNDEQVVAITRKALSIGYKPHYLYWYLIAALVHLGRIDEAQAALAELRQINPKMATVAAVQKGSRSQHPAYVALRQRIFDGVRKAGMPEELRPPEGAAPC
jgi:TolB-like protein/Flp pilus assembly protein TadD